MRGPVYYKHQIRRFFNERKWKRQRAKRGFSDFDVWEIDTWFIYTLSEMLEHLALTTESYPERCETYEKWKEELLYYSFLLKTLDIYKIYETDTDAKLTIDQINKNKEDFFTWFRDNLWDLWD